MKTFDFVHLKLTHYANIDGARLVPSCPLELLIGQSTTAEKLLIIRDCKKKRRKSENCLFGMEADYINLNEFKCS